MKLARVLIALAMMFSGCGRPAFAQAIYGLSGGRAIPDRSFTPGVDNPLCVADLSRKHHEVTVAVHGKSQSVEMNICADDFHTAPIRATIHNFAGLKKKACAEYGIKKCDASVEGDHFEPIELCGKPDDIRNIWPQPMSDAKVKDHEVEDWLPKLVCAGKISLADAQKCVTDDWVSCIDKVRALRQ